MPSGMNPIEEAEFDEGVLGAIDAGLEASAVKPPEPTPEPEPKPDEDDPKPVEIEQDEDAPPAPPIDLNEDDPPKPDEEDDPKPGEEEKIAAGEESEDKGTPVPTEDDPPAASIKAEDAKPSDEFGELEADAKPATKERFDKLRTGYDKLHVEHERVSQQNTDWMDTVKSTGANPEQLGQSFEYLTLINQGTQESLESAYTIMQGELDVLAKVLGKEAPGFDPLAAHADLKAKVDDGYIDRDTALELAGSRATTALNSRPAPQPAEMTNDDGAATLSQLGGRLRGADPEYDAKLPQINEIVKDVVSSGAPPSTWAKLVEAGYNRIQLAPKPVIPKPAATPNPIRPGVSEVTGGFNKEAGNIMDAIDMSLERGY